MGKILICHQKMVALIEKLFWVPALLTRVAVGGLFVQTGWGKLTNLPRITEFFQSLGIPLAHIQAPLVSALEFGCGILIFLGLFTRLASVPLIFILIVAIVTAKLPDLTAPSEIFGISETLLILLLAYLVVQGPGCVSVDTKFLEKCRD